MNRVRWVEAAEMVRKMIKAGEILPGDLAPSAVELAGRTGVSRATCRKALLMMATQGELLPPVSRASRPRIPGGEPPDRAVLELSFALAAARRAAGLTQAQLAERTGLSTWSVHSAETGEFRRPAPETWAKLDQAAGAGGELVRLHAAWQASRNPGTGPSPLAPSRGSRLTEALGLLVPDAEPGSTDGRAPEGR